MKLFENQKQKIHKSSESHLPLIHKRARSNIQASKDTSDARLPKTSNERKNTQAPSQDLSFIYQKVHHYAFYDKLKRYVKEFLNKTVESEYFVNKLVKSEIIIKFLEPLGEHRLLKFVSLNGKFNLNHVNLFYCNLKVTSDGLECPFRDQLIKFTLEDFKNHFGLLSKGDEVCISNAPVFVKFDFVKSIYKFVLQDCPNLANFHISQVKIEMIILHCIIMKVLYKNPWNWERADDHDLYLMTSWQVYR